ncbi:MAG: molybdenum cofactor biosynthesis protein MoaE [Euryarchaeota archaeon]|nr:molybdenum cofactor biosynthesis protein MoaE [Euryarchaeota archaeon]
MAGEWVRVQREDFSVEEEINRIKAVSSRIGGIVTFLGTVRDFSRGKEVEKLEFEHYPGMAEKKLEEIRRQAKQKFDLVEISVVHRYGELGIGENIVLIVAAAEHRRQAFEACRYVIDELKKHVPIWKKEYTSEGEVWVEEHP